MKKLPPIEKIYEAYSAIADDRVTIRGHRTGETGVVEENGENGKTGKTEATGETGETGENGENGEQGKFEYAGESEQIGQPEQTAQSELTGSIGQGRQTGQALQVDEAQQTEKAGYAEHVGQASVLSSSRAKTYTVAWSGKKYASNDNATYWQGYAGYPVIAVLMLQNMLPLNKEIAAQFANINWTKANAAAKRDYARAVETVFAQLSCDEEKKNEIRAEVAHVYEILKTLNIEVGRLRAG